MIQLSAIELPNSDWQTQLKHGFRSPAELLHYLELPEALGDDAANTLFATRVPRAFAQRMRAKDANDPLLRQVLATSDEHQQAPGFVEDPVGDLNAVSHKGLIHKYHGRVLLMATGVCAVNCRYCFRRSFPYGEHGLSKTDRQKLIDHIRNDSSIEEVIFSGGDPLMLNDQMLASWIHELDAIPHLKRLRFHSRLPIVLPDRIDQGFLALFENIRLQTVMVVHANHAQELSDSVSSAIQKLKQANFTVLNQSVLLAGINDEINILTELSQKLFAIGVLPYYIHSLDRVIGASHFLVSTARAIDLHKQLMARLPGYLVPKLVQEQAGEASKTWINNR